MKIFTLFSIFISVFLFSQETVPPIEWGRVYLPTGVNTIRKVPIPGTDNYVTPDVSIIDEQGNIVQSSPVSLGVGSVKPTPDGGFIVVKIVNASIAASIFGDSFTGFGGYDAALIKLNSSLEIEWAQNYGGSGDDQGYNVEPTSDGGYIFVGRTNSVDGQLTGIKKFGSDINYYIVKTDSKGEMQWTKTYGGNKLTPAPYISLYQASQVIESAEGGYLVAGTMASGNSGGSDITNPQGSNDIWVLKLDTSGNLQWQKSLGGSSHDNVRHIRQLADGNYIICGNTESADGDVSEFLGKRDGWIVKLNAADRTIIWDRTIGGSDWDNLPGYDNSHNSILDVLPDGNLIVIATVGVGSKEQLPNYPYGPGINTLASQAAFLLAKINSETGSIIWQKVYGPSGTPQKGINNLMSSSPSSVTAKSDGSIIVFGHVNFHFSNGKSTGGADFDPSFTTFDEQPSDDSLMWTFKLSKSLGLEDIDTATNRFVYYPNPVRDIL
ncbi:MAG: hypothetical protein LBP34_00850, partial [Flavobacteriaceae bacterium]|nr:hypothetical protein [Flavobacteriaceae bacterium]